MKQHKIRRELYFALFLIVFCLLAAAGCAWMGLGDMAVIFLLLAAAQAFIVLMNGRRKSSKEEVKPSSPTRRFTRS